MVLPMIDDDLRINLYENLYNYMIVLWVNYHNHMHDLTLLVAKCQWDTEMDCYCLLCYEVLSSGNLSG